MESINTLYLISRKGRNQTLKTQGKNLRAGSLLASVQIMTLTMPNTGLAISSILHPSSLGFPVVHGSHMAFVSSLYANISSVPLSFDGCLLFSLCLPSIQLIIAGNNIYKKKNSPLPCKSHSVKFSQLVALTSSSACASSFLAVTPFAISLLHLTCNLL